MEKVEQKPSTTALQLVAHEMMLDVQYYGSVLHELQPPLAVRGF